MLGYILKCLQMYIHQLGFNKIEKKKKKSKITNMSVNGTVKIYKTFLSFHDS